MNTPRFRLGPTPTGTLSFQSTASPRVDVRDAPFANSADASPDKSGLPLKVSKAFYVDRFKFQMPAPASGHATFLF